MTVAKRLAIVDYKAMGVSPPSAMPLAYTARARIAPL